MRTDDKQQRIEAIRDELAKLEQELAGERTVWEPADQDYYGMYHATSGLLLGMLGALVSLLFNVVGSSVAGLPPLRIIQIYLTFPLGEKALSPDFDTGMALALGCCLYLGTGMLLGVPFQMAMARVLPEGKLGPRLIFATLLGLLIWGINFYGILAWLQPALFGGAWIVDPTLLPPWVGAATHIVFAWTMAVVYPWGRYEPYRRPTHTHSSVATEPNEPR